jgi:hypothetical protein
MFLRRLSLCALLVTGCTAQSESSPGCAMEPISFCKDVDIEESSKAAVTGSTVTLQPTTPAAPRGTNRTYTVSSSAPELAEVVNAKVDDACGTPSVTLKAKKAGTATITYAEVTGGAKTTATFVIVDPARITATSYADALLQGKPTRDGQAPVAQDLTSLTLAERGRTGLLLRYFDAKGASLRGVGAATFAYVGGLTVTPILGKREGAELTGTTLGAHGLDIASGDAKLHLDVSVVKVETVTSLRLYVESDQGAKAGQTLGVLARASDAQGATVYGAPIIMSLGTRAAESGDLLQYPYKAGSPQRLLVEAGGARTETTVSVDPAHMDSVTIGDSHRTLAGCQVGGLGGGGSAGLLAIAALMVRRRRQAGARARGPKSPSR